MRLVVILLAAVAISVFGLSGYALGEILDEFSPNNNFDDDKTHTADEKLETNLDAESINWENSIMDDQNFSVK